MLTHTSSAATSGSPSSRERWMILSAVITAFVLVMFLFWIDEGYYDFRWMRDIGNWIVFVGYYVVYFGVSFGISALTFRRLHGWAKLASVMGIMSLLTLGCMYGFSQ